MQINLKDVMDETIKMVNHIKSEPLIARLFKILCEGMQSGHTTLL
jgi:hypothetical protein